jgi:acyl-CoA reductase-like NAD-dependent aldehyde dehydrogenase
MTSLCSYFLFPQKVHYDFYKGSPSIDNVGRIVNAAQFGRVQSLLSSTKGKIVLGGKLDVDSLYAEPTVVVDLEPEDSLLTSEVFGPILPVVRATDIKHAISLAKSLAPESLGLYVFSEDSEEANTIVNSVPNGSTAINDVMAQIAPTSLPFGGFGASGFGSYRGKASIDTFSHQQSIVTVPTNADFEAMLEWRYPYADPDPTVEFIRANMTAPLPPA